MKREINVAQLAIVDGAWQEAPDNVARFEESPSSDGTPGRGSLYLVVEVTGEPEGRDTLVRELIETARREYAQSRGSITLALEKAVRAANDYFYNWNAATHPEARRIAGMTAAILRDNEMFIAQAGPGMTALVRGTSLQRFPEESLWFDPAAEIANFPTPGTVPMGLRRNYSPDQFHLTLQSGDAVLLATRTLAHLLSNEELLDTLTGRHPDEIITNLEDIAGSSDLSILAIQFMGEGTPATSIVVEPAPEPLPEPVLEPAPPIAQEFLLHDEPIETPEAIEPVIIKAVDPSQELAPAEPELEPPQRRVSVDWTPVRAFLLRLSAILMGGIANIFARVDWKSMSARIDRAITLTMRAVLKLLMILFRGFLPVKPGNEESSQHAEPPRPQTGWMLATIILAIALIAAGIVAWNDAQNNLRREQARQNQQIIDQAIAAIEAGKNMAATDKNGANAAFKKAMDLAQQARVANPNNQQASAVYYQAEDALDTVNGISVLLFLPSFANFSGPQALPTRIVTRYPDVFVLDRGMQRIYHYLINDAGSAATPTPADGIILKKGDPVGDRTVNELIDMFWIDVGGKLIVVDKSGAFLQYSTTSPAWSVRVPIDGTNWTRISLASSYAGNLYLADAGRNQILRYTAITEGTWTSYTTYFAPGVAADLTNVIDIAIDGDVWMLRGDGSIMRYTSGRPNDLQIRDLETPLSKPVALYTNKDMSSIYIADAGNQRIVQIDKTSGKFQRQFKPRGQDRDAFKSLKTLAVDEANKKFFFINGSQAYLATIPQ